MEAKRTHETTMLKGGVIRGKLIHARRNKKRELGRVIGSWVRFVIPTLTFISE